MHSEQKKKWFDEVGFSTKFNRHKPCVQSHWQWYCSNSLPENTIAAGAIVQ